MSHGVHQEGRVPGVEDPYEEAPEQKRERESLAAEQMTQHVQRAGNAEDDHRAPPLEPAISGVGIDVPGPTLEVDVEWMVGPSQVRPPPAGGRGMRITRPIRMRVVLSVEGDPRDGPGLGGGRSEAREGQLEPPRHAKASMSQEPMEAEEDAHVERQRDHDETAHQTLHREGPEGAERRNVNGNQGDHIAPVDGRVDCRTGDAGLYALAPTTSITESRSEH